MNVKNFYNLIYKVLGWWRLKTKNNFGFLGTGKPTIGLGEYIVGWEILQPSGQWDNYLPDYEYQRFAWGDTMACVTYSMLNCLETLLKRIYNEKWDFSDRFTAKESGTTSNGNTQYNVIESFRRINGFLSFLFWRNETLSWSDYYASIPPNLINLAKQNLKEFNIQYEWIEPTSPEKLKDALKNSPLWISIYAYGEKVNGVYQRIEGNYPNHCVELYGYDENGNWKIFDHYLGCEKRLLASDYLIGSAVKIKIIKS